METIAVIDFETTGLSPRQGDRATEIAAVLVRGGEIIGRYQSLMQSGVRIPAYIESLTGISNQMVSAAPPAARVMSEVADFVGDYPLVAHNASFDTQFWDAELARIQRQRRQAFACSMLVARRVLPHAPSHQLGVLVEYAKLPVTGQFHRAMADSEMTASLVLHLQQELCRRYQVDTVTHELLRSIQQASRNALDSCISRYLAARNGAAAAQRC